MLDNDVRAIDIGWNSLGLCPNCAAEYNYCSKSISGLYEQVKSKEVIPGSDEPIEIDIEIPKGTSKKIKYSPRHFMAIKAAISFFEKTSNSGINNDDK